MNKDDEPLFDIARKHLDAAEVAYKNGNLELSGASIYLVLLALNVTQQTKAKEKV